VPLIISPAPIIKYELTFREHFHGRATTDTGQRIDNKAFKELGWKADIGLDEMMDTAWKWEKTLAASKKKEPVTE